MQNTTQLQALIKKNYRQNEQYLNLQQKHIQWIKILELRDWKLLKQINLRQCKINDKNVKNLVERQWPVLKKLLLWKNQLSVHGIKKILEKEWPSLQYIELDNNEIGNQGLAILSDTSPVSRLKKLKRLQIGSNKITKLYINLFQTITIQNLQHLTLSQNSIGSNGIKILVKAKMPNLQDISLNNCSIGDEGVNHIVKADWSNLEYLHLQRNAIGYGYLNLANNNWRKLRYASVGKSSQNGDSLYLVEEVWGLALTNYESRNLRIQKNVYNLQIKKILKVINNNLSY